MLITKSLFLPVKVDVAEFLNILSRLSDAEWKPAFFESKKTFFELAGIYDMALMLGLEDEEYGLRRRYKPEDVNGDVIFRAEDLYYILSIPEGGIARYVLRRRPHYQRDRDKQGLELGIITSVSQEIDERLDSFVEAVKAAITSTFDGRKVRFINFQWEEKKIGTPRLDSIMADSEEESSLKFLKVELKPEEVEAARVLENVFFKRLLRLVSQAGFLREKDILGQKSKDKKNYKDGLEELSKSGLLCEEYLLECKKTGMPLTRLKDPERLNKKEIGGLKCPSCNSDFSSESLSKGYSMSELGSKLTQGNHWMTIWITELLTKVGIPLESILWNISESGEEVDLLVEFFGRLWIFELKDREFGAGDAHPLNYRKVRYRADRSIIITTAQVSKDAKNVFEELAREARSRRTIPVYVEGLESAEQILHKEITNASLHYAQAKVALIGELTGYDFNTILRTRYKGCLGLSYDEPEEEEID